MDVGVIRIPHVRMVFSTYVSGIFSIAWNVYCMQFVKTQPNIYLMVSSNPIRRWSNPPSQASAFHCVAMSRPFVKALRWQIALVAGKDNSFYIWQDETPGRLIMIYASQLIYIGTTIKNPVVELVGYNVVCGIVLRDAELVKYFVVRNCQFINFIYQNPPEHRFIAV